MVVFLRRFEVEAALVSGYEFIRRTPFFKLLVKTRELSMNMNVEGWVLGA